MRNTFLGMGMIAFFVAALTCMPPAEARDMGGGGGGGGSRVGGGGGIGIGIGIGGEGFFPRPQPAPPPPLPPDRHPPFTIPAGDPTDTFPRLPFGHQPTSESFYYDEQKRSYRRDRNPKWDPSFRQLKPYLNKDWDRQW